MIKSWDYKNEYNYLKKDILASINKVFKSGNLFFGDELKKFEKNFKKRKIVIDQVAAMIILDSFLQSNNDKNIKKVIQ